MKETTYLGVAIAKGLKGNQLLTYVTYMFTRWGKEETLQCTSGYAEEWADRFLLGIEFEASDCVGQALLNKLREANEGA